MNNTVGWLKAFFDATLLPGFLFAILLLIDAFSVVVLPIDYELHFRFVNDGPSTVSALAVRAQRVRSDHPDARVAAFTDSGIGDPGSCGEGHLGLDISIRSHLFGMDRTFNGPIQGHARDLGLRACRSGFRSSAGSKLWSAPLGGSVVIGLVLCGLAAWRRHRPTSLQGLFDWRPTLRPAQAILYGALAGLGIYAAVTAAAVVVAQLGGGDPAVNATGIGRQEVLWSLLPAVLAVPLVEEYIFRALLQERVGRVIHPALALVYTSLVFTGAHLPTSVTHAAGLFVFSVLLGVLWLRTRSLWSCALAHAVFNVLASLALWRALG